MSPSIAEIYFDNHHSLNNEWGEVPLTRDLLKNVKLDLIRMLYNASFTLHKWRQVREIWMDSNVRNVECSSACRIDDEETFLSTYFGR
jgi:hypothetical protein